MSREYIPKVLRKRVAAQAGHRCGYCRTSSVLVGTLFEIDHIVRNGHESNRVAAVDPPTDETVRLFDPRHQTWSEHFAWSEPGDEIVGLTPAGRATVAALQLNRSVLVYARWLWTSWGCHPPED
jgi:hypothetical protein